MPIETETDAAARVRSVFARADRWAKANVRPGYYLTRCADGHEDADTDWCYRCGRTEARLRREAGRGKWEITAMPGSDHHDSPPRCEGCSQDLLGLLTDYGVDVLIEAFEGSGTGPPTSGLDCYLWRLCYDALWDGTDRSAESPPFRRLLAALDRPPAKGA